MLDICIFTTEYHNLIFLLLTPKLEQPQPPSAMPDRYKLLRVYSGITHNARKWLQKVPNPRLTYRLNWVKTPSF
ncbi:MAG: hypothetical protein LH613_09490 [Chamaesiphon sp.]|nr:hypothetical protein [Chamaesiphon sp.]